ncbi:hypothetical protein [Paenibacillus elgii]|uniref:hypothetical protein n=1 Tax=Paenibacillus elgii TaxID=189691 RepID=UPI0013CF81FC|nr:hypothetical protein [Paenibacillus elgii]
MKNWSPSSDIYTILKRIGQDCEDNELQIFFLHVSSDCNLVLSSDGWQTDKCFIRSIVLWVAVLFLQVYSGQGSMDYGFKLGCTMLSSLFQNKLVRIMKPRGIAAGASIFLPLYWHSL